MVVRRPLQRSSVLDHSKRSMISYRCSDFLIFRNLAAFPLAVWFSDPLGLDPPGSLGLSNSELGGPHIHFEVCPISILNFAPKSF